MRGLKIYGWDSNLEINKGLEERLLRLSFASLQYVTQTHMISMIYSEPLGCPTSLCSRTLCQFTEGGESPGDVTFMLH